MSERYVVLIVEDDAIHAMDLVAAVEDLGGDAAGPVPTVAEALAFLEQHRIDGAVLDANLADRTVTPVALRLIDLAVPFIIHTGIGLPSELAAAFPHVSVMMKPAPAAMVVGRLLEQLKDLRRRQSPDPLRSADAGSGEPARRADQVARIAAALHDQFGEKALVIAHRQAIGATPDVERSWSAIIARLEQLAAA